MSAAADPSRVIALARGWLGTPHHHQASLRGVGCDCLGVVRGIWRELGRADPQAIPPYSLDWGEAGAREVLRDGLAAHLIAVALPPAPGDVVLFRMRSYAIAKHAAVLVAPDRMVHAHSRLGVIEESVTQAWWRRAAFAFRFPG